MAPAKAGPSGEPLLSSIDVTRATVSIPALLDQNGPALSDSTQSADDQATEQPVAKPTGDLASMVGDLRGPDAGSRELECLATGIYFESKGEPLAGQLAVGKVIANRMRSSGRFPGTYCGVLFQRSQFSFVHGHSLPTVARSNKQWQTAVAIAKITDQGLKESVVGDALFFHARYVAPAWRLKRVASIGNHVFYR